MARLPQVDYEVNVQGPPNTQEAWNSLAKAAQGFQDIQTDAMMRLAHEQARSQVSIADSIVEVGLGELEKNLSTKPYLSADEVVATFGDQPIPPHVQAAIDKYADESDKPLIPTALVGGALHDATAKQLAVQAGREIWSDEVRAEFEQSKTKESIARRVRLDQHLAENLARAQAINEEVAFDADAEAAYTPEARRAVLSKLERSGFIDPARKAVIQGEWEKKWRTEGLRQESARYAEEYWNPGVPDFGIEAFNRDAIAKDLNPLVVEDVRQRMRVRMAEEKAVRLAQDSPRIGRLEASIYAGQGFSRLSDDYVNLSDEGKAAVQKTARSVLATGRAEAAEARRLQNELNAAALNAYRAVDDLKLQATTEIKTGDDIARITGNPLYAGVDQRGFEAIRAEQAKFRKIYQAGAGATLDQYLARVTEVARGIPRYFDNKGNATDKGKDFLAHMKAQYTDWAVQEENRGKRPTKEQTDTWIREALEVGEETGGRIWNTNMRQWEARQKGKGFTSKGFESENKEREAFLRQHGVGVPGGLPRPATMAEAEALAPGTRFIDPNGVERVR